MRVDVHQHLWTTEFIDALRARTTPPRLDGWVLHTVSEPPYRVDPDAHDPLRRDRDEIADLVGLGLSSPIGIEHLAPDSAAPLLRAWHDGATALGGRWRAWASTTVSDPDLGTLDDDLAHDRVLGLQVPATALATPDALEAQAPVLERAQDAGKPVLVHPGPAAPVDHAPPWWPPVVSYVAQLQAAWWAWYHAGRALLPTLRICFAAGAGLAPLQHERATARGAGRLRLDPDVFVETSSLGPQGIDALVRVLGVDVVCLGSDRPYAEPSEHDLGAAADLALAETNPRRLITPTITAHPDRRSA